MLFDLIFLIIVNDGIVIATEKKLHSLVKEDTIRKIEKITDNIGMVYSGMGPDFRVLVRKARKKAQAYYQYYKEDIPVAQLVREIAAIMQEYTQTGFVILHYYKNRLFTYFVLVVFVHLVYHYYLQDGMIMEHNYIKLILVVHTLLGKLQH